MGDYVTFVIRVFVDQDNSMVEGQITHVGTQQTVHFREITKAIEFIESCLSSAGEVQSKGDTNGSTYIHREDQSEPGTS